MYASSFDLHDHFCQQIACALEPLFGCAACLWCRTEMILVSGCIEHRFARWAMQPYGSAGVDLACSAAILLQYASRSCRGLRVGMVIAGGLHGFVVTNRNTPFCVHMK